MSDWDLLVDFSIGAFWGWWISEVVRSLYAIAKTKIKIRDLVEQGKEILKKMEELRGEHHIDPPKP